MILRVGLTGGLASGKSTIARLFASLGCVTVDADAVVSRLYRPGGAGHEALVREYGKGILTPAGEIDRKTVADIAFANEGAAQKLNALIHPLVIAEETAWLNAEEKRLDGRDAIYVIEATLLLESGGKQRYDRIVVVDVDPRTQLNRAMGRGMAREEALRRMAHQMDRDTRLRAADYVIDNSDDIAAAEVRTRDVVQKLQADLRARKAGAK